MAAVCATGALTGALVLVGAAGADVGDGILGGVPTNNLASTVCPAGSAVTAAVGDVALSNDSVLSVTVRCNGGAAAASGSMGDPVGVPLAAGLGTSDCTGGGVVAVGIEGGEDAYGITYLGLRCAYTFNGIPSASTIFNAGYYGGLPGSSAHDGPYDCPDGEVLTGLTGSVSALGSGSQVEEVAIQCGSLATSVPPMVGLPPFLTFIGGSIGLVFDDSVTITNTGGDGAADLQLGQLAIQGTNASEFVIGNDPCSNTSIAAGASCSVTIQFSPEADGNRTATLVVPSNAASSPDSVALSGSGIGVPPTVSLSPSSIPFGTQLVGTTSAAQTLTITNTAAAGSQSLLLGQLSLGGSNSGDFSLSNNTCSNPVAAGSSCTVDVRFAPTAVGSRSAILSIPSNAPTSPDAVALSGTGTPPGADVKLSISGPTTAASGSQNTYVVTVSNLGPATATGVVMTVQVPSGTKFVGVSTTQGSCTHPASGATSGTISCSLGNLTSGAAAADSVTLKLSLSGKGGTIALVASASASTPDPDLSNNVATLATTVKKK
ncbi:MAG TPA: choice-of-anchor D domain-containing protein [Gaiellaceae bacterium]|nr:choice-of-anchor D domain-containing protein [Gaiellaceae bacterium]